MPDKDSPYVKGIIWLGLVFLLSGGAVMCQSIAVGMDDVSAPRWVGFIAGVMFFNAGLTVSLMDSTFNTYREKKWFSYFHALVLLSIFLIFLVLFNWVSFGPGEREFSMEIGIPFFSFDSAQSSEIIGRIAFGIPTFFMDVVIGYVLYSFIAESYEKKKDAELDAYIEEMSLEDK